MVIREMIEGREQMLDIETCEMLKERAIYIGEIDRASALEAVWKIRRMSRDCNEPLTLVLADSPGGSLSSGLMILDAMNSSGCEIRTVALGLTASMAAVLLACGTKGKRFAAPNAEIMIHQALSALRGSVPGMLAEMERLKAANDRVMALLAERIGRPEDELRADMGSGGNGELWLNAAEAAKYGIVDRVIAERW